MKSTHFIILIMLLGFCSCRSAGQVNKKISCIENESFKKYFFYNVNYIKKNITKVQDIKFKKTLEFLSKYVHVSFDAMSNYANTYPIGVFEKDKKGWLEWYEKNKCKNLQIKDNK